jgi:hypothetical protein
MEGRAKRGVAHQCLQTLGLRALTPLELGRTLEAPWSSGCAAISVYTAMSPVEQTTASGTRNAASAASSWTFQSRSCLLTIAPKQKVIPGISTFLSAQPNLAVESWLRRALA